LECQNNEIIDLPVNDDDHNNIDGIL